jgi:hypothetical protein
MPANLTLDRGLPQNIEAERSVLGTDICENSLFNQAVELLKPRLLSGQQSVDFKSGPSISHLNRRTGMPVTWRPSGGRSFVSSLIDGVPKLSNLGITLECSRKATLQLSEA